MFDVIYLAAVAAASVLACVSVVDSAVSWPWDRVLVAPAQLETLAGWLLFPFWVLLLVSMAGLRLFQRHPAGKAPLQMLSVRRRVAVAAVAVAMVAFIVGGFLVGAAKGSLRMLPGPRYQVSTPDLNHGDWTTVSAVEYGTWEARFVREDAVLTLFGAFQLGAGIVVLSTRRHARHEAPKSQSLGFVGS